MEINSNIVQHQCNCRCIKMSDFFYRKPWELRWFAEGDLGKLKSDRPETVRDGMIIGYRRRTTNGMPQQSDWQQEGPNIYRQYSVGLPPMLPHQVSAKDSVWLMFLTATTVHKWMMQLLMKSIIQLENYCKIYILILGTTTSNTCIFFHGAYTIQSKNSVKKQTKKT